MLTMRPTGLASPAYATWEDWTVLDDGRVVGRIYEDRSQGTPRELRCRWSITRYVPPRLGIRTDNKVESLAEAKQQFRRTWEAVETAAYAHY
jgi:hypothetical protein